MNITLTGADERTKIDDLIRLTESGAEIGLLYTISPDGRNRYPCYRWIDSVIECLHGDCAIHVCGKRARDQLISGDLLALLAVNGRMVKRIQINGCVTPSELRIISRLYADCTIITQHNAANAVLAEIGWCSHCLTDCFVLQRTCRACGAPVILPNHALLVDGSGGRGILPAKWEKPDTDRPVGFAGGLSPENLATELPKIAAVATSEWWIDMESSLRNHEDWFSVSRAWKAVGIWQQITSSAIATAAAGIADLHPEVKTTGEQLL